MGTQQNLAYSVNAYFGVSWMRQAFELDPRRNFPDWRSTGDLHAFHYSYMTPHVDTPGLYKLLEEIERRRSLDSLAKEIQDGLQARISGTYGLLLETHPKVGCTNEQDPGHPDHRHVLYVKASPLEALRGDRKLGVDWEKEPEIVWHLHVERSTPLRAANKWVGIYIETSAEYPYLIGPQFDAEPSKAPSPTS